jgi:hypothetical protein
MKFVVGFFWLLIVVGVLGIALVSGPERRAEQQQTQAAPQKQNSDGEIGKAKESQGESGGWRYYKKKIEDNEKFITATSTLFIAGFTIALAFATFFLWLATRNLVEDAKETSEKQLRAYIGIQSNETTVYPFELGGFAFIAHAELRNFGQTPAYDLTIQANAAIDVPGAIPFNNAQSPAQTAAGPSIAFRDAGVHVNVGWPISEEDKIAIYTRKKNIFLWGTVRYRDVFDKRHYFTFRLINGQIAVGTTGVYVMGAHPLGYDSD